MITQRLRAEIAKLRSLTKPSLTEDPPFPEHTDDVVTCPVCAPLSGVADRLDFLAEELERLALHQPAVAVDPPSERPARRPPHA